MFYVYTCDPKAKNALLAEYTTEQEAFKMASELLSGTGTYDTYVTDTSRGYSRIIGFGSTGKIEESADPTDPCTRGGSVLFGREID